MNSNADRFSSPSRPADSAGSAPGRELCFWRDIGLPIVISISAFSLANGLWNLPNLKLYDYIRPSLPTYLVGGSGVALVLLWRATRQGVLSSRDAGLDTSGWTAPRRLTGVALVLLMGFGGYSSLPPKDDPKNDKAAQPDDAPATQTISANRVQPIADPNHPKPGWGDYCFWFVHLLAASLAELLVFVSLTFCLLEKWLKSRGLGPFLSWLLAAAVASVAFGLYHYTHEPRWYDYVFFPLMPVMMLNLAYFGLTRNFYLTLMLHNGFAAVGFTQEQYHSTFPPEKDLDPATFVDPQELWPVLVSFLVPFLLLHVLEATAFRRQPEVAN